MSSLASPERASPSQGPAAARTIIRVAYGSFVAAPLLAISCLYGLSLRIGWFIGHWPMPSVDDPKYAGPPNDTLINLLYAPVLPLYLWSMIGVVVVPLLTAYLWLRRDVAPWLPLLLLVLFFALLGFLFLDPFDRMAWYID